MAVVYVRVRDPKSRQEWDEPQGSHLIVSGAVEVIKADRYPPSTVIRPTKRFRASKARVSTPKPAGEGTPNPNEE